MYPKEDEYGNLPDESHIEEPKQYNGEDLGGIQDPGPAFGEDDDE